MKLTQKCPKCDCRQLHVVEEVAQPAHDSPNIIVPLNVATFDVPSVKVGVHDGNTWRAAVGRLETWICSACGFTEWYARDFTGPLKRHLEKNGKVCGSSMVTRVPGPTARAPGNDIRLNDRWAGDFPDEVVLET